MAGIVRHAAEQRETYGRGMAAIAIETLRAEAIAELQLDRDKLIERLFG